MVSFGEFPSLQLHLVCSAYPDAESILAQSARLSLSHEGGCMGEEGEEGSGESVLEPSTQCWSIPGVTLGALSCGHFLSLLRLCPWVRIDQWLQSSLWNQNPSSKAQLFLLLCGLGNLLHFFSTQFLFLGADKCSSFSWLTGLWPSYASVSFFVKWC